MSKEILIGSDMSHKGRLNGYLTQGAGHPFRVIPSDMSELGRVIGAKGVVEKPLPNQGPISR